MDKNLEEIPYVHTRKVHNLSAATEIVPVLIEWFNPGNVIDIGCGLGSWLKVFEDHRVDITGVDGSYVDRSLFYIDKGKFLERDLGQSFSLKNKYDLVLSLEVAEHIPQESADVFVENLVRLGDIIIFSAAIPGQRGHNHINENIPSYWQKKFEFHGYQYYDLIRPLIWNNKNIEWWYRQNMFVVARHPPKIIRNENTFLPAFHPEYVEILQQRIMDEYQKRKDMVHGKVNSWLAFKIFLRSLFK